MPPSRTNLTKPRQAPRPQPGARGPISHFYGLVLEVGPQAPLCRQGTKRWDIVQLCLSYCGRGMTVRDLLKTPVPGHEPYRFSGADFFHCLENGYIRGKKETVAASTNASARVQSYPTSSGGSLAFAGPSEDPATVEIVPSVSEQIAVIEELVEEGAFDPSSLADARIKTLRAMFLRQGQPAFRRMLLKRLGGRCVISGCDVPEVLEAAHICPYQGLETNDPSNGLILRSDLHNLFDCGLIFIDEGMTVNVHPNLRTSAYRAFHGRKLHLPCDPNLRPSSKALAAHRETCGTWA